jgi:exosome complex component RRP41
MSQTHNISWESSIVQGVSGSVSLRYANSWIVASIDGPRSMTRNDPSLASSTASDASKLAFNIEYASHLNDGQVDESSMDKTLTEYQRLLQDSFYSIIFWDKYPKSIILVNIMILESSGKDISGMITSTSLALLDSGIALRDTIIGIQLDIPDASSDEKTCDNLNKSQVILAYASTLDEITMIDVQGKCSMSEIISISDIACQKCSEIKEIIQSRYTYSS